MTGTTAQSNTIFLFSFRFPLGMTLGRAEASVSECGKKWGESAKRIVHEPLLPFCRTPGQVQARKGEKV